MKNEDSSIKEFLEYILKNILTDQNDLSITQTVDALGILLEVKVSEHDMGKLIGKGGQTVKSIRTLLRLMGAKSDQRVNLRIAEPSL
jgi:uncharacterized protein